MESINQETPTVIQNGPYTYGQMLDQFFQECQPKQQQKHKIPPPKVTRSGAKKTAWENCAHVAKYLNRDRQHLADFLFSELGTNGSFDAEQNLLIKGRYVQKHIMKVIKSYIKQYVACPSCQSFDTKILKRNKLQFLDCQACQSESVINRIDRGFQAQIGKRRILRQQAEKQAQQNTTPKNSST